MDTNEYIKFLRTHIEELRNQRNEAMERNAQLVYDKTLLRCELQATRGQLADALARNGEPNAHLFGDFGRGGRFDENRVAIVG